MELRAFHVGDGDCVLLSASRTGRDGAPRDYRVLIDGGRKTAFRDNARDELYALDRIDVVCVSHIDEDHIAGILGLIEDSVAWKIHRHLEADGRRTREPSFPPPPEIGEIWHNPLFELVGEGLDIEIESSLSAATSALAGLGSAGMLRYAAWADNLANGERSSMELSRRISTRQLGIPRNRPRDELMLVETAQSRRVGPMTFWILGPTEGSIDRLRKEWRTWIDANQRTLRELQAEMLADEDRLASTIGNGGGLGTGLGDGVDGITTPNLASLMLLVQERRGGPSVLLTGDGESKDILDGLAHFGKLDGDGRIHVDVLKIPHHGAEANVTEEFVERVTADHYLFCGNGAHHNPERSVVEALAKVRLGVDGAAVGPTDRPFTFWFTTSPTTPGLSERRREHMTALEELVTGIAADHDPDGRFDSSFLRSGSLHIDLGT